MSRYEIMLILDPTSDVKIVEDLAKKVFGKDLKNIEKLKRTQLAYKINNSTIGIYQILNVSTKASNIKEFTRKVNLQKTIFRSLIINLDIEEVKKVKSQIAVKKQQKRREAFQKKMLNNSRRIETKPPIIRKQRVNNE